LAPDSRAWLAATLDKERSAIERQGQFGLAAIVRDPRVWALGLLFGSALVALYGLILWLPLMIKGLGQLSDLEVGFLSAVAPALGVAGALLVSRHSDRVGERKLHMACCYTVAGLGLLAAALVSNPVLVFVFLCVGNGAVLAASPLFWTIAGSFFTGAAAAVCIALVNTIAQFGGLIGPWLIGMVKDRTGSYALSLDLLAAFLFVAALIAVLMKIEAKGSIAPVPAE
jgi:cyanate permease